MADWKVFVTVKRRGEIVPNPEIVFGHFGKFVGDADGIIEVETVQIPLGMEVFVSSVITDTRDHVSVAIGKHFRDTETVAIDLFSHGKYLEPEGYTPPIP